MTRGGCCCNKDMTVVTERLKSANSKGKGERAEMSGKKWRFALKKKVHRTTSEAQEREEA